MRCQLCLNLSWHPICKNCLTLFLTPNPTKRVLEDGLCVYPFYSYDDIKNLLHTKHTMIGSKIFKQLSTHAILPFFQKLNFENNTFLIPIDDHVRSGYSHTAVMANTLKKEIKPLYKSLRAKNKIRYSGQKLYVRKTFKRDFTLTCKEKIDVILLDDIVTSGNTLKEANAVCKKNGLNVLCAVTLANARNYYSTN